MPRPSPTFLGPDLFNPPPHQGWISLTPSFTLSGEYNDNLSFTSRHRQSDEILRLTPGLTLSMQKPDYRLAAGYNTSGELFFEHNRLSDFGKQQQFFTDFFYQISPRVTFTLADRFLMSPNTNALTSSGVSVGRQDAWLNTFTPRLRWQATRTTGLDVTASYTTLRFQPSTRGGDSDTYRVGLGMDRQLTARLTGLVNLGVAYLDVKGEPAVWTYTPMLGFAYTITPTLVATVRGGPSFIEVEHHRDTLRPSLAATLTQRFKVGSLLIGYDRAVIGDTIGATEFQSVFAALSVTPRRGLTLELTPRYSSVNTDISRTTRFSGATVETLTATLRGTYRLARTISLLGSYTFYRQTVGRSRDGDIDQNQVFLGLQYAFPINFY